MLHSSIVGGSTAKRVMACPGSVNLCAKMPPKPSSVHADRGTLLQGVGASPVWRHVALDGTESLLPLAGVTVGSVVRLTSEPPSSDTLKSPAASVGLLWNVPAVATDSNAMYMMYAVARLGGQYDAML